MAFEASIATIGTGMPIGRMSTAQAYTNLAGSVTQGFWASLSRAPMRVRHEEKSSGTVLQEVRPMRKLASHAMPRGAPVRLRSRAE